MIVDNKRWPEEAEGLGFPDCRQSTTFTREMGSVMDRRRIRVATVVGLLLLALAVAAPGGDVWGTVVRVLALAALPVTVNVAVPSTAPPLVLRAPGQCCDWSATSQR